MIGLDLAWALHSMQIVFFVISRIRDSKLNAYLIFVIFFTLAKFLENKIYTEKRQFFALNL